jgi:hypothetical protein
MNPQPSLFETLQIAESAGIKGQKRKTYFILTIAIKRAKCEDFFVKNVIWD